MDYLPYMWKTTEKLFYTNYINVDRVRREVHVLGRRYNLFSFYMYLIFDPLIKMYVTIQLEMSSQTCDNFAINVFYQIKRKHFDTQIMFSVQ